GFVSHLRACAAASDSVSGALVSRDFKVSVALVRLMLTPSGKCDGRVANELLKDIPRRPTGAKARGSVLRGQAALMYCSANKRRENCQDLPTLFVMKFPTSTCECRTKNSP